MKRGEATEPPQPGSSDRPRVLGVKHFAELTPCRRAARQAALPLCEGENKAFSPSQRGRRERSERGGRVGDFLCTAPTSAEEGSFFALSLFPQSSSDFKPSGTVSDA